MHADPAKVERIQRGSRRLPHQATLFGKAALRAVFNEIAGADGAVCGYVAVWKCIAEREHKAEAAINDLHAAAAAVSSAATELAATWNESSTQAEAGAEETSASITEISRHRTVAASVAAGAVDVTAAVQNAVSALGVSSREIGGLVATIHSIAQQTNMLALNATIEAARAGELGMGFAVVAGEVKQLARETAAATEDIRTKVESIQVNVALAASSMADITRVVDEIRGLQRGIASAVEEQTATALEISRSLSAMAQAAQETAAQETTVVVSTISEMATTVERLADDVQLLLEH
jgi:methyl-accepting chemotaxis protein